MLAAMPSTAVWVDMTGNSPAAVRELATAARAHGVGVLDAPVGGDAAVLDRCRRVLEALADPQRIIRVGGNDAGYTAKLLVNLLSFGQAVATGEALLLARRAGIDLDVLRQTVATSAASHRLRPRRPRRAARRRLPHVLRLDRCCEELTAIADLARELRVPSQRRRRAPGGSPSGGRSRTPAPARPSLTLAAKMPQSIQSAAHLRTDPSSSNVPRLSTITR
jgi:3-hydroxyisobutyrate dehydrogenase